MAEFATLEQAYGPREPPFTLPPLKQRNNKKLKRQQAATLEHLTSTLPLSSGGDSDDENNFQSSAKNPSRLEPFETQQQPWSWESFQGAAGPAPPPASFGRPGSSGLLNEADILRKLDRLLLAYDRHHEPNSSDVILYTFTGLLGLFVFDKFVNIGRQLKGRPL
jgi:hypothetical protein